LVLVLVLVLMLVLVLVLVLMLIVANVDVDVDAVAKTISKVHTKQVKMLQAKLAFHFSMCCGGTF
jgi:hypothetical protein